MNKDLMLVIDPQNVYLPEGAWGCANMPNAIDNIKKLLDATRRVEDIEVVFTKYIAPSNPKGTWKKYNIENAAINSDEYANEIVDNLSEYTNFYKVYSKDKYSSLSVADIKQKAVNILEKGNVVVTGVVAECCVLFTVAELIDLGASVIYITDAVAGFDKAEEEAVITVLKGLSPLHIRFMTTKEYLKQFNL